MNPHEHTASTAVKPGFWRRRPKLTLALAGLLVCGAAALSAFWYFRCGDCDGNSPILCGNPCTLPTFGQLPEPSQGKRVIAAAVSAID